MPVSKAKRRANDKWDAGHMKTLGTRLRSDEAEKFTMICKDTGITVSGALSAYVRQCNDQGMLSIK